MLKILVPEVSLARLFFCSLFSESKNILIIKILLLLQQKQDFKTCFCFLKLKSI